MFQDGKLTGWPAVVDEAGVRRWLEDNQVDVVHVGLFDTSGTLRQKRYRARTAVDALVNGWSFIDAVQHWAPDDTTYSSAASTHEPACVDLSSVRPFPFEPGAVSVLADFTGRSAALSGRHQLSRLVERAAAAGLAASAGWEFELIVLDRPSEGLVGADAGPLVAAWPANRCWSGLTPAAEADTMADWTETLEEAGIAVHHTCSELGPGCLELALGPLTPVRSADDAALAKLYTKAFFARRGQTATFMAQLSEEFPGLGGHPSLSLSRLTDGSPALAGTGPFGLSSDARHAIGGIVTLLPELLVMATPTTNSYRRYAPGNWAPRTATWGVGNYTCGLRVVADRPEATRLELRIPGADTTPHLCLAMMLGAALWGIEHGIDPPEPVEAPQSARDLVDPVIGPLPRSLSEAADRFAASKVAVELFGPELVDHLVASRLAEDAACRRYVSPQERARYLDQV